MSIGDKARIAIETECSAIKAGNVHPTASFHDLNHQHFLSAAKAIGDAVDQSTGESVGTIVLRSTQAMIDAVGTNTSLGTILLLAPLVATHHRELAGANLLAIGKTLADLTSEDARHIYHAIQIAKPSGLGDSASMDVRGDAPMNVLDAMQLAAEWDDVALQYVTQFKLVFEIAERIESKIANGFQVLDAIRCLQMELLSERIDSLIGRKLGREFAEQVQQQADRVLASGPYGSADYEVEWQRFDNMLRDKSHRGNPGTIADLVAAALFVCK